MNLSMETNTNTHFEQKKKDLIQKFLQTPQGQIRLQKKTSNLFRHRVPVKKAINVRDFNQVIQIDKEQLYADVEGMTTYETLVAECLKYDCLPTVVPELKTITVGGALSGGAIESSSFRYGLMHETVLEFEILLSDGRVILCQPDNEHRDLFYGFANSYGTLGYALRVRIKLYPCRKYVKLSHLKFNDVQDYFHNLAELCLQNRKAGSVAFIDGTIFSEHEMYITTGEMVEQAPYTNDYTYLNIYYQSIQQREEDYLSIKDYIWRWDTDWFWCSKFFYLQNNLLRRLLGKKRLNSKTYWRIRNFFGTNAIAKKIMDLTSERTESVIQDVQIPIENTVDFLKFFNEQIKIKPIWICPTMAYDEATNFTLYSMSANKLFVNFGFWDVVSAQAENFYNRLLEEKVKLLHGKKSLYSEVTYTEEEFWSIFNKAVYNQLKAVYDPQQRLLSLYQKCTEK